MAKKRLDEYNVQPKETAIVVGTVQYSRFLEKIDGTELEASNKRALEKGQRPDTRPYYQLTIADPTVNSTSTPGSEYAQYLNDRTYISRQNGQRRLSFKSTSPFPITTGQYNEQGIAEVVQFDAELAPGQIVAVVVETFRNSSGTLSSSFKSVIVPAGPISYYESKGSLGIAGFGMPFETATPATYQADVAPATTPVAPVAPVAPATPTPFGQTAPVTPFGTTQTNEPVATAPAAPFGTPQSNAFAAAAPASPFGATQTNTVPATPFG